MKKSKKGDKPIGKLREVADFLPSPAELVPKEQLTKITLAVDDETVKFFKKSAIKMPVRVQLWAG